MEFNNSRLQQFLTCPQSYQHRYIRGAVPRKRPTYFVFGSAIHKFIEIFYRTKSTEMALRAVENEFKAVDTSPLNREEIHELEVDKQTALGIASVYPNFYKADFDNYKTFLTEQKFTLTLPCGEKYYGTIDGLIQDHAGDWWILETKTASAQTVNADYFERVKIDSQVAGYMHGAKHMLGSFPRGVVYNVIKKPSIRLKNGESLQAFQKRVFQEYTQFATEKAYFTRHELLVAEHRLNSWLGDTDRLVVELATKHKEGDKWWHKNTGACRANFGSCAYLPACVAGQYNKILYMKEENPK